MALSYEISVNILYDHLVIFFGEEERADCFTLIAFLPLCVCLFLMVPLVDL